MRKGRLDQMVNHATGWVRMEFLPSARGLLGFRTEFLTETRGTGILHHVFDRWEPWAGDLRTRPTGALVSDRHGSTASFALFGLQERGSLFIGPGEEVYEGMIVGENSRSQDLDVNPTKEKHQTNVRAASADILIRLHPAPLPLARAVPLEFLREDECIEITPEEVRLRKVELDKLKRQKAARTGQPRRLARDVGRPGAAATRSRAAPTAPGSRPRRSRRGVRPLAASTAKIAFRASCVDAAQLLPALLVDASGSCGWRVSILARGEGALLERLASVGVDHVDDPARQALLFVAARAPPTPRRPRAARTSGSVAGLDRTAVEHLADDLDQAGVAHRVEVAAGVGRIDLELRRPPHWRPQRVR